MNNIFLMGEVGIGKSAVISKTLALLPAVVCGGFRTVSAAPVTEGAMLDVFIEKVWEATPHDVANLAGTRWGDRRVTPYPAAFDTVGVSILAFPPADAALLLMDELGVMEDGAELFRQAVMAVLDGPLPVLGVIKPKHSGFLDAVRAHPRSAVIDVTENNRDELPARLAGLLIEDIPHDAFGL